MNTETQTTENVVELKTEAVVTTVTDAVEKIATPRRGRPPKSLSASGSNPVKKTAPRGRRIKEPAKKAKRLAGVKAQTQVPKAAGAFIKRYAKDNSTKEVPVRAADVTRKALLIGLKRLGYVDPEV